MRICQRESDSPHTGNQLTVAPVAVAFIPFRADIHQCCTQRLTAKLKAVTAFQCCKPNPVRPDIVWITTADTDATVFGIYEKQQERWVL